MLIPAVGAVLVSTHVGYTPYPIAVFGIGTGLIVASFFVPHKHQFKTRWFFGIGLFISIFSLFSYLTQFKQEEPAFDFSGERENFIGTIDGIPQEKNRSYACNIKISHPAKKKIVLYLQKESEAANLQPGQEIVFHAQVQPFRNFGNPDDFDYARFMTNKGFSGTAFVSSKEWRTTGREIRNLQISALQLRMRAIEFYRNFEFSHDAHSFLSALTLGHKQDLTNELVEAFRASGTSHVLAVSGLHVGIVYLVFAFIFSFLGKSRKSLLLREILIITALWMYAMLTGLSPSVIRAAIMLTIVSIGIARNKRGFTYNTLAVAAFILLAYNPLYLFDIGFQMSFGAVISILFFGSAIGELYEPKRKFGIYAWDLFAVSTSAQLGIFPISLYYFGTFPTYFFIANMIIVPIVGLIIHFTLATAALVLLKGGGFIFFNLLFAISRWILKLLIDIVLHTVYLIESLPYSQITESYVTIPQMLLIISFTAILFLFLKHKRARQLITLEAFTLLFVLSVIQTKFNSDQNKFVVFNTPNRSEIGFYTNKKRVHDGIGRNGFVPVQSKRILLLSENLSGSFHAEEKARVDILILSEDETFAIENLNRLFHIGTIVFDSSTPQSVRNKWLRECRELGISAHDVSQHGAFVVNL